MARNPYIVDDDAELRKAALVESGVDPELLEEPPPPAAVTPEAQPAMPVAPEAPPPSSKSDRVREAIYAAGTRQKLSPDFFTRPAKEAEAAAQREILKQRVMAQWSKRQAEAAALKRKSSPDSEESKIAVALWESSPEGSRIMENMRANHPELAAKVAAAHIPEWKVALPHEQRTAAPAQKAAAAVEAAPALEAAKGGEARKTLDDKQAGDKELQAQKDAEAYKRALLLAQQKRDALGSKAQEKELLLEIPGLVRNGKVAVKPEVAEKLREKAVGVKKVEHNMGEMAKLMRDNAAKFRSGAWLLDKDLLGKFSVLYNDAKMGIKDGYGLGALVGGDFQIIDDAVANSKTMSEVVRSILGISAAETKLAQYPSLLRNHFVRDASVRGYDIDEADTNWWGSGKASTPAAAAPKAAGPTKDPAPQTKTIGGKTYVKRNGGWVQE